MFDRGSEILFFLFSCLFQLNCGRDWFSSPAAPPVCDSVNVNLSLLFFFNSFFSFFFLLLWSKFVLFQAKSWWRNWTRGNDGFWLRLLSSFLPDVKLCSLSRSQPSHYLDTPSPLSNLITSRCSGNMFTLRFRFTPVSLPFFLFKCCKKGVEPVGLQKTKKKTTKKQNKKQTTELQTHKCLRFWRRTHTLKVVV